MTVNELIEKLKTMPQEMKIKVAIRVYEDFDSHTEYSDIWKIGEHYSQDFMKKYNIKDEENFIEIRC